MNNEVKKVPSQGGSVVQNIILEGRRKLSVSGVDDMESFDETSAILHTQMGILEIKGNDLRMNKLSLDTGEVVLDGEFDSVVYLDETAAHAKGSFLSRLLK